MRPAPTPRSGHFLVEACRFLGDRLYDACRRCDELASEAEEAAARVKESDPAEAARLLARAEELRARVEALPDPDNALVAYLPSRAREGGQPGLSEQRARALCRRLAAVHCIYGVDKNPLAVALARVAIWIESHAEGLPLTFLDHRLVVGDSLTGPFAEHLYRFPGSQKPLDDLFNQGLQARLAEELADALRHVAALEESVGIDAADIERKRAAKARLDGALAGFRLLAAAWAGGVMLGKGRCDDEAYAWLARWVAGVPEDGHDDAMPESLRHMVARGLGLRALPEPVMSIGDALVLLGPSIRAPGWLRAVGADTMTPALPYDLAFPEVFYPAGTAGERHGFDVVVGNPPWDTVRPLIREFYAGFNLEIMDVPTKHERDNIEMILARDNTVRYLYNLYVEDFELQERVHDTIYYNQRVVVDGKIAAGDPDLAKLFAERFVFLSCTTALMGMVMPGAFHTASGAVGVRRLLLEKSAVSHLLSFNNARLLFEVESKVKFDLVVARKGRGSTNIITCAFRLTRLEDLIDSEKRLQFSLEQVRKMGGLYQTFVEIESPITLSVVETSEQLCISFQDWSSKHGFRFRRELDPTTDSRRVTSSTKVIGPTDARDPEVLRNLINKGILVVSNEDSIHLYTDHWTDPPRYVSKISLLLDKKDWLRQSQFYRILYRRIANIIDLRSMKAAIVPPGWISSSPFAMAFDEVMPSYKMLALLALLNSFCFDFHLRLRLTATLNMFLINSLPVPSKIQNIALLPHAALRLTCNHAGYAPLWREQVGEAWREERAPFDWPVLAGDDARWAVRAAIDAVVAEAYGLSREQYAHVLSTFSHKSYPKAPELCLAAFDELKAIGLEAFTKKHDPYWDIPLNENLPEPVIDLPIPQEAGGGGREAGEASGRRGRRGKTVQDSAPVYAEPQLPMDLGEPEPAQQVIDFAEAVARRAPGRKAAETPASYDAGEAGRYERVKALLAERGSLANGEVQFALAIDATAARALLKRLVDEGLARQEGERRGARYVKQ